MGAVYFTREIINAIITIAQELEKMNKLKKAELDLEYGTTFVDAKLRKEW